MYGMHQLEVHWKPFVKTKLFNEKGVSLKKKEKVNLKFQI